jgi:hypothetical protein
MERCLPGGAPGLGAPAQRAWCLLVPPAHPPAHSPTTTPAHPPAHPQALPSYKNPQCYTNTLWALANWRHSPGQAWLDALCAAGLPYLQQLDSAQLPVFICSLAQLQHHPGHNLACYLLECLHRQHRDILPKSLAACVGALAQLLRPPDAPDTWQPPRGFVVQYAPLLADLAGACRARLRQMDSGALVAVVEGFAGLGYFPGDAFMVRHEQQVNARVTDLSVYQITGLKRAYQRLDALYEREYGGGGGGGTEGRPARAPGGAAGGARS